MTLTTKQANSFLLALLLILSMACPAAAQRRHRPRSRRATTKKQCNNLGSFVTGCDLPFTGRDGLAVDQQCPIEGCTTDQANQNQNRMKNNLCGTKAPVEVSFNTFDELQRQVDTQNSFGYKGNGQPLSADRSALSNVPTIDAQGHRITLSEGDVVTLTAFVLEAKHDDVPLLNPRYHGESVNCNNDDVEFNDIHVVLGQTAGSSQCSSVTAEIIPHHRPALWDRFDSNPKTSPHLPDPALPVQGIRVRITGQLFFDGSHAPAPCGGAAGSSGRHAGRRRGRGGRGQGGDPPRRSVWEIHPVYRIEVFDGGQFVPFETWAGTR